MLRKLEVIPEEAEQVKAIFEMYLRMRSVRAVAEQVDAFGWRKKKYETKTGKTSGGGRVDRNTIHRILRNRTYTGCVVYKGEIHEGEHDAIIDVDTSRRCRRSSTRSATARARGASATSRTSCKVSSTAPATRR